MFGFKSTKTMTTETAGKSNKQKAGYYSKQVLKDAAVYAVASTYCNTAIAISNSNEICGNGDTIERRTANTIAVGSAVVGGCAFAHGLYCTIKAADAAIDTICDPDTID